MKKRTFHSSFICIHFRGKIMKNNTIHSMLNSFFWQFVDKYGINKCIEMALDHIDPLNDRDYHISFDIDALDRFEAPSTGYSRKRFVALFFRSSNSWFHWNRWQLSSFFNYSSWWFNAAWRHTNNWSCFWNWPLTRHGLGGNLPENWRYKGCKNNNWLGHRIGQCGSGQ